MPNSVAVARVRLSPSFWRSSATSARMPPSPSLSARITRATYLRETRIVIDQNTIEMIPKTSTGVGRTVLCSMLKAVCNEYSGLVPMSPKTTPSAPRVSTAFVLCPGPGASGASGAVIAPGSVPGCPTLGSAPLLVTLEWSHIPQARTATRDPCDLLTTANGSTLDNQWEPSGPIRKGRPAPRQYVVQPGGDGPQDERHATVEPHATEDVGRVVHGHFEPRHADDDGPDPAHERCHDAGTFVPERGQDKHRRDGRGDHQARVTTRE